MTLLTDSSVASPHFLGPWGTAICAEQTLPCKEGSYEIIKCSGRSHGVCKWGFKI
jgi:hypothetical protein